MILTKNAVKSRIQEKTRKQEKFIMNNIIFDSGNKLQVNTPEKFEVLIKKIQHALKLCFGYSPTYNWNSSDFDFYKHITLEVLSCFNLYIVGPYDDNEFSQYEHKTLLKMKRNAVKPYMLDPFHLNRCMDTATETMLYYSGVVRDDYDYSNIFDFNTFDVVGWDQVNTNCQPAVMAILDIAIRETLGINIVNSLDNLENCPLLKTIMNEYEMTMDSYFSDFNDLE